MVYLLIWARCGWKELLFQGYWLFITLINKVTHLGWLMQCIPPELVAGGDFFPLQPELILWISGTRKAFITHLWGSLRYCEGIQHTLLVPVSNDITVEICWPPPHYGPRNCLFCLCDQYFINLFVPPPDKFNQNIRTALYSRPKGSMLHFCIDHFAGKVTVFQWVLNHSAFIVSVLPKEQYKHQLL